MATVSRQARLIDLAALVCIIVGAGLCLVSNDRLQALTKLSYQHPGPRSQSALAAADRARYIAYGGVAFIVLGCVVGAGGAIAMARRKRLAAAP
ncbi:MAG: hypothetical protein V4550_06065 [Gemmatimonadota bacterium]